MDLSPLLNMCMLIDMILPSICSLTHLEINIICRYKSNDDNNNIFVCKSESKFSKWLKVALDKLGASEFMLFGFESEQLGTHYFRKGSTTYVNSSNVNSSIIVLYHRAGWSIGNVQQRYMFPTDTGDQLIGRIVCWLPESKTTFCVIPPHFKSKFIMFDQK